MNNTYIKILFLLLLLALLSPLKIYSQKAKEEEKKIRIIESFVKDENGSPIRGAIVYGDGGAVYAITDASGKFSLSVPDRSNLLIEAADYESRLIQPSEYISLAEFTLKTSPLKYGEKDLANIAFGKKKRGDLVNAVSTFNAKDLVEFDYNQSIAEAISRQIPGLYHSGSIRNYGTALTIVDGLPRDISSIKMSEVEQVTVLKDLNSSLLYGSAAANGVILVTTKRGEAFKRKVNVTGNYGILQPRALPKYLGSAEYMKLFNEARLNDGLSALYSQTDIDNYTTGNEYRYPSVDWYSDNYLKPFKPYWSIVTELSGGNENAQYYTNIGWDQEGTLLNFGEGANSKRDRFNVRANVDLKIIDWITTAIDVVGIFDNTKGPTGANYWSSAATMRPNLFSPLIPINLIDPDNALLLGRKNDVEGKYLLGGTSTYQTNAIASSYSGGTNTNIKRTFSLNNRVDFNLDNFVKGLGFHTNLSFDFYTSFDQSIQNNYATYLPTWLASDNKITNLTKYGADARPGIQNVLNGYYTRRFGFYGMFDYDRTFGENHNLAGALLLYGNTYNWEGNLQAAKNSNLGLRLNYSFRKKYMIDFSSTYANSVKLPKSTRLGFSPSLGAAWILSREGFMSSISAIDFLKLRFSVSDICTDEGIGGYYFWEDVVYRTGTWYWFETSWYNVGTRARYGPNPNLSWEKRKDLNFGIEGVFFNKLLSVDANVFTNRYYDMITRASTIYPSFYLDFIPYDNFGINAFRGAELGITLNKKVGDIDFSFGTNFLYATTKVIKRDEIFTYDYQYRKGKPLAAIFGLVDNGFYSDDNDIRNSPLSAFGGVKPGDLKYKDQNNDNIVDSDDQIQIGRSDSPYSFGLNLKIVYKNFTLFTRASGRIGADGMLSNDYYWVDGTDKYSEFILNRWTPATRATATFPRLTSLASSNNYRSSTFWLYNANNLTIDAIQLTYDMPGSIVRNAKMKNLKLFVNGYNLLMIARNKDIMELAIGAEPYYRSFSIGLKTVF